MVKARKTAASTKGRCRWQWQEGTFHIARSCFKIVDCPPGAGKRSRVPQSGMTSNLNRLRYAARALIQLKSGVPPTAG